MHVYFYKLFLIIQRNRAASLFSAVLLLILFGFVASKITFSEDISQLIPKNEKADITTEVLSNVNFADKITVIVSADKPSSQKEMAGFADAFLQQLSTSSKDYYTSVQGKLDSENFSQIIDFANENLPLLLDENDYKTIDNKLRIDSVAAAIERNYKSLISPSGLVTKDIILQDPLGLSFIGLKKLRSLGMADDFTIEDGYIFSKDKRKLLLFIDPKFSSTETEQNSKFAENLENIQTKLNSKYQQKVTVKYFGASLIAVANAKQIKQDIQTTTAISFTALLLILIFYYRKWWIPLLIFLPTIIAGVVSIAILFITRGKISAISLGIGSILIGVTVDYALHVLTHYRQSPDIKNLFEEITKPVVMSALTTAIAFLCLLFIRSSALQDLGIFAASMVVVSAVVSLVIIPQVYIPKTTDFQKRNFIDKLGSFNFERSKMLLAITSVLALIGFLVIGKLQFNNDISQLNFVPTEIKAAEKELYQSTNLASKSIFLVSYADNLDDALKYNSQLQDSLKLKQSKGYILSFASVGNVLPSKNRAAEKIERWNSYWQKNAGNLKHEIVSESEKYGFKSDAYQKFFNGLDQQKQYSAVKTLGELKSIGISDLVVSKSLTTVMTTVKVNDSQRQSLMSTKFTNTIAIDRQEMNERFLGDLRADLTDLLGFCFLAIIIVLALFFRSTEIVIVSTIPIFLTGLVVAALMWIFNLQLNIFSSIVCVLIFGHGVDFSIFMTLSMQREYSGDHQNISVSRTSILLAVITTVLGIGAMVFAKHPALHSIAAIALIGVVSALLITFVLYPRIYRLVITSRRKSGLAPLRLRTFIHGVLSFLYFGIGAFLMSLFATLILPLPPMSKKRKSYLLSSGLSKLMKSVLYTNPFVKKSVLNISNETFEKPCIIIANHSSFLDILAVGMLSPNIVFMVSDWVYKSPVFGGAVRAAGFLPASAGIESNVEKFRETFANGKSVVIFPEGTRSMTNKINRFKKGAMFLFENLEIDIVPILVHGTSEVLPKGDFIIYDGPLTVEILPRINFGHNEIGKTFAEKTKNVSAYFKNEFSRLRNEVEKPDYFYPIITQSYHYKMRWIESSVKEDLHDNGKIYNQLSEILPNDASIFLAVNDFGQIAFLLEMFVPERRIVCLLPREKLAVAKLNYLAIRRNVIFVENLPEDLTAFQTIVFEISKGVSIEDLPGKFDNIIEIDRFKILKSKN